jgi:hypothetical protein
MAERRRDIRARRWLWALNIIGLLVTFAITWLSLPFGSFVALEGGMAPKGTTGWLVTGYVIMFGPLVAWVLSVGACLALLRLQRTRSALIAATFPLIWPPIGLVAVLATHT